MIAIAVVRIPTMARVVRSDVLALREEEFVDAARALGQRPVIVLFKHVLMNAWAPALVLATLGMGTAIVVEAALSFLGLGRNRRRSCVGGCSRWAARRSAAPRT